MTSDMSSMLPLRARPLRVLPTVRDARKDQADEASDEQSIGPPPPTEETGVEEPEEGRGHEERDEAGAHDGVARLARSKPEVNRADDAETGAEETEEEARDQLKTA